jgi:thiol-disulfide isomerase/thioredoxin
MKKNLILTLFFLVGFCNIVFAQKVKFEKVAWAKILEKSKKENKPIFVDFYATWCGPCKELDNNVYTNKKVGKYMNQNFINVKIDAEKEELGLVKQAGIDSYPTLIYYNSLGEELIRFTGYRDVDEFLEEAEMNYKESKLPSLASLEKSYQNGERNVELLGTILKKRLNQTPLRSDSGQLLDEYLQKAQESKTDMVEIMNLFFINIKSVKFDSKAYAFFTKHIADFKASYDDNSMASNDAYLQAMNSYFAFSDIERALEIKNEIAAERAIDAFKKYCKLNTIYYIDPEFSIHELYKPYYLANDKTKYVGYEEKYLSNRYPIQKSLKEIKEQFKSVYDYNLSHVQVLESDSLDNPELYKKNMAESQLNSYLAEDLNNAAWGVYENTEDVSLLKKMLPFAKMSVDINESYYNTDTYAHILDKTGEHQKALWLEKKSSRLAKYYASESESAAAEEELEKFSVVYKKTALKPMALDNATLENHIEHYLHYNMMLDYEKITDFMPPYFLKQFPKEQLIKELQGAYEMEEIFVNLDKADLKIGSSLVPEKDQVFAKLNMFLEMTIDISKMVNASEDIKTRKTMIESVGKQYANMYGKDNFTLDENKATFKIKTKSVVYAIGDKANDTWKFINYEVKLKGVIDEIVPEAIRDKLK